MSTIQHPIPFIIPKISEDWLYFQEDLTNQFYTRLHYHPELQITLILEGEGTLICGDYMDEFGSGDVFVMGSNVSHVFKNRLTAKGAHSLSLFIETEKLDNELFNTETRENLAKFYKDSLSGLKVKNSDAINELMQRVRDFDGLKRMCYVLIMLDLLITPESYEVLGTSRPTGVKSDQRMNEVIQYTLENFHEDISLDQIAEIAHMTKSSFCRYFKQHTLKTYSEYLAELRINQACQLLRDPEKSIRDVCFESGYSNISHFNRKFRTLKNTTPSKYRTKLYG